MAYTHFFRRDAILDPASFSLAVQDISLLRSNLAPLGVILSGPTGDGKPEINDFTIAFNGPRNCGHPYMDLGKPYPSPQASGVMTMENPIADGPPYISGPYLNTRACGGNCAADPLVVDQKYMQRVWERPDDQGRFLVIVQTYFKPYDLMVTASLVRLKERLGEQIQITSDGNEKGFEDAKRICRELFGFPARFELLPADSPNV
jgi:hypothetical protein